MASTRTTKREKPKKPADLIEANREKWAGEIRHRRGCPVGEDEVGAERMEVYYNSTVPVRNETGQVVGFTTNYVARCIECGRQVVFDSDGEMLGEE